MERDQNAAIDSKINQLSKLPTKPLSEFSVYDVIHLLESLNLRKYCTIFQENVIDGPTLMNCKSENDVIELGITFTAKARILFKEIVKFKSTVVPLTLLFEVCLIHFISEAAELTLN